MASCMNLTITVYLAIIECGLILALVASHEHRIERSKNSWRGAFLTSDAGAEYYDIMVPDDGSELIGSFDGDGEPYLEVRRHMPEIPHLHQDYTTRFWSKLVSGHFRVSIPSGGNYRLIVRSPRTPLSAEVVQDATKVLEHYKVVSYAYAPRTRISIYGSEIDLVEFLERHFEPLKKDGSRPELFAHLQDQCKDWSSEPGYLAKWDQLYPGLYEDLARTLKNVPGSPSIVGELTYRVNRVSKPYEWLFKIAIPVVTFGLLSGLVSCLLL